MNNGIDRTLLVLTRIGVFLVPFIPLIVASSMFFPFITGKNFAFRIIVEVLFALWLLLALRNPEIRPKRSFILLGVTAFLSIVLLADIGAENPFKAFWSNFERMEGFITLIHLGAYFLVASSVLSEEKWWHRFFATSVGVSAFLGIYGLLQLGGKIVINQGGVRLDGTFGNAAYFAGYMLFHIFLSLFLIFRHRIPLAWKWPYGAAILLQIFVLIYTATRGAGVGLVIGLFVTLLLVALLERGNRRLQMGAAGVLIVLALLVWGVYAGREHPLINGSEALKRFASISVSEAGPRFMVWNMAWQGFNERPLLGWGQEGFNYVFNKQYDPNMWGQEQWFDRTHNIFFDWLISAGALGLLAYLSLFFAALYYIWAGVPKGGEVPFSYTERAALTGLLVSYMVHNFFVFDNLISYIMFFSLLSFIHMRYGRPFFVVESYRANEQVFTITSAILVVALSAGIYFFNVRPIAVSHNLIGGLKQQEGGIKDNLSFYRKAYRYETIGTQEVGEQAMQMALAVANASNIPQEMRVEFVTFATEAMKREIERAPKDARLRMFLGGFYNRLGNFAEGTKEMEKARELSPGKQTIAFELANSYVSTGKTAEALALLKQTLESAPEFNSARIAYAIAAVYAKQFPLAEEILASSTDKYAQTDERLIKAYFDVKQYPKVISLIKLQLERRPDDPQVHVSLAAAYIANGNRNEAVASLQKAVELNPEFKQQGEFYINEIKAGRNP